MEQYAWIELVMAFGIAIGVGLWQYFKMDRELKRDRAQRAAREAAADANAESGAPSGKDGHPRP